MSLHVIHVITTIDLGGAEKQLLTLATCQKLSGSKVEIIFLKDEPRLLKQFMEGGILVDTEFSKLSFFGQMRKLRAKKDLDGVVFHAHLPRAELLCALSLKNGSFIVSRHNAENFFPMGPKLFSKLLSRFVLKRAFALISISQAVSTFLRATSELGAQARNEIIPYGIETSQIRQSERGVLNSNCIKLGTVSRLVHQKNIPLLLKAMQKLTADRSYEWSLQIVGVGPLLEELQSLSCKLGIQDSVDWLGQMPKIEDFYKNLDVFVLTSDYEGFGLVLLEAMSAGIPVIARNISAIPEVLGSDHPGLINSDNPSEFAVRISKLAMSKELCLNFLKHQSRQLSHFSIERAEITHRALYKELLAEQEMRSF
jgi:glycosyltransferase involved in cell wall biosynthesis